MSSSIIPPGSYVWYIRKNYLVKILDFDIQSNSYTIEYKGRVIDTIEKFLDRNIIPHVKNSLHEKATLEKRVIELETTIQQQKQQYEYLNQKIDAYFVNQKQK